MQNIICYNEREVKEGQGSKEDIKRVTICGLMLLTLQNQTFLTFNSLLILIIKH